MYPALWTFDARDMQRQTMKYLRGFGVSRSRSREVTKSVVHDMAREAAKVSKRIVADEASDGGRLAAGIGYYEPGFLRRRGTGSNIRDPYWQEFTAGNIYRVEFGTNVPYATPIMLGFTMDSTRVVFSTRLNKFITVHPFSFLGVHAYERAAQEVAGDRGKIEEIFNRRVGEEFSDWLLP